MKGQVAMRDESVGVAACRLEQMWKEGRRREVVTAIVEGTLEADSASASLAITLELGALLDQTQRTWFQHLLAEYEKTV